MSSPQSSLYLYFREVNSNSLLFDCAVCVIRFFVLHYGNLVSTSICFSLRYKHTIFGNLTKLRHRLPNILHVCLEGHICQFDAVRIINSLVSFCLFFSLFFCLHFLEVKSALFCHSWLIHLLYFFNFSAFSLVDLLKLCMYFFDSFTIYRCICTTLLLDFSHFSSKVLIF